MLAAQKACSAFNKIALTQCLRRKIMEFSVVGGGAGGSSESKPGEETEPKPQKRPVIDETLDQKDEAHEKPWRDGICGITHMYDTGEAKSLQQ